ncbi:hypothetical protein KCH_53670 [Kitasatospora cheerisanensis KCTC 2395]|uniref:Uncharacterized protein n=1 Tax=Kitasatospora cheerisanensis KCTC 2395 TaxID=1348663 RepID=A0A066YSD3_9ACTN|nr:hypothetical protein KCH_53670 [Kitasatospora cheerisanensis KCTC 2395]
MARVRAEPGHPGIHSHQPSPGQPHRPVRYRSGIRYSVTTRRSRTVILKFSSDRLTGRRVPA